MNTQQPQTPIHLITSTESSSNQFNLNHLKSPLNSQSDDKDDDKDQINQGFLKSPLNSLFNQSSTINHESESIEIMLKNMIFYLKTNSTTNLNDDKIELDKSYLNSILEKSLNTINHLNLQNNILKFENNESNKRFNVESNLIKSQVDYLLKSPFKPSQPSQPTTTTSTTNSLPKKSKFKIEKN
ncbi:hypothetical protein BN7_119 [Wickerhamomyces ciferrii]|uniref:Uncharacterized protein n=1 Tax=Wickerhamomyces ciferrii (strain ATCC 14091 / BCRC 22168 / CBS 111 / JCM 3599 / NBRC 0793 / NRRL Y-1031 F-60-10) TaxID=1206466 RepID=K0KCG1_WICCF|nr:uncharacterized protein BN7_119 [Wickerhamomyces ciferrii]CCH40586.1 hypothetical protein BN7_119 [Wickerhamomyces ciferrii]